MRGVDYLQKIRLWNRWVTGRVKLHSSYLSPTSSSPTGPTQRHTARPCPAATKHLLTLLTRLHRVMDCREGDKAYCYSAAILRYCYWLSSHGPHKEQTWAAVNQPGTGGFAVRWRAFDITSWSWLTSHCRNGMHAAAGSSICQEWDAGSMLFQQPAPGPRWHLMALPTLQIVCVCVCVFILLYAVFFLLTSHSSFCALKFPMWCKKKNSHASLRGKRQPAGAKMTACKSVIGKAW